MSGDETLPKRTGRSLVDPETRLADLEEGLDQLRRSMTSRLLDVEMENERLKGVQGTKLAAFIEFVRHASQDPIGETAEQKFRRLQERAKKLLETPST